MFLDQLAFFVAGYSRGARVISDFVMSNPAEAALLGRTDKDDTKAGCNEDEAEANHGMKYVDYVEFRVCELVLL